MKFQPPKGTRDFLPEEMIKREFVIDTIKNIFTTYGFDPLETPAFEYWKLLAAKCGEDVKQQIFKFKDKSDRELGLRFDLTVPMARVVANNPQLPKPFKRYAIAPVWRYEEVTAGRKREFYQCDIDIVGSSSMNAEAECLACAADCLKALGFNNFKIVINSRKILEGLLQLAEIPKEKALAVFRAIDKLGKISDKGVKEELTRLDLTNRQIDKLLELITAKGECEKVLKKGRKLLEGIEIGESGLGELEEIFEYGKVYGFSKFLVVDFSLARGLDYYNGPIFEIVIKGRKVGSVAGGGRYDGLIELLGGRKTPATGISLGIERILEIMKAEQMLNLPKTKSKVFVAAVDEKVRGDAIKIAQELRSEGISCQIDLMSRNLTRQLEFADAMGIPFVIIVGEEELKSKKFKLKDMEKKSESSMSLKKIIEMLKNHVE